MNNIECKKLQTKLQKVLNLLMMSSTNKKAESARCEFAKIVNENRGFSVSIVRNKVKVEIKEG